MIGVDSITKGNLESNLICRTPPFSLAFSLKLVGRGGMTIRRSYHSGMFPCFLGGFLSRLFSNISNA
jgi:hypothetical protein